jgi:hypothetical protein
VCGCFEFLPRKRELPGIFLSKSLSLQSGEDEAFILSSAVMKKMHAMKKLRKTLELLAWVGSPPRRVSLGTLHNMFWMKITKRTQKEKRKHLVDRRLSKNGFGSTFFFGLLGTIVPTSGWQKPLAKFNTCS